MPVSKLQGESPGELDKAVSKKEGGATLRLKKEGEAVIEKVMMVACVVAVTHGSVMDALLPGDGVGDEGTPES